VRSSSHAKQFSIQHNLSLSLHGVNWKTNSLISTMITTTSFTRYAKAWLTQNLLVPTAQNAISLSVKTINVGTNSPQLMGSLGLAAVALGASLTAWKWRREEYTHKYIEELNSIDCGLATDHLENGEEDKSLQPSITVDEFQSTEVGTEIDGEIVGAREWIPRRGVGCLNVQPVEVPNHRRVRKGRQMKYMNCILAECKAKFGTPVQNEANRKAVQRFAGKLMSGHGLRPSHIREYLPMVVSMTFVPTEAEVRAMSMLNSTAALTKKVSYLVSDISSGFHNIN